MDTVQNIINFFIASGILALLIRSIIKLYIDKDIEKFKSELQKEATQFKIQYEKLHAERAEVVKQCYKKIVVVTGKINNLTSIIKYQDRGKDSSACDEVSKDCSDLFKYYQINALYFEKETQELFNVLFQKIFNMFNLCQYLQYSQEMGKWKKDDFVVERITEEEFNKTKQNLREDMDKTLDLLKNTLEQKFKNIIGVES